MSPADVPAEKAALLILCSRKRRDCPTDKRPPKARGLDGPGMTRLNKSWTAPASSTPSPSPPVPTTPDRHIHLPLCATKGLGNSSIFHETMTVSKYEVVTDQPFSLLAVLLSELIRPVFTLT